MASIDGVEYQKVPKLSLDTTRSVKNLSRESSLTSFDLNLSTSSRASKRGNPINYYENNLNLSRVSSSPSTCEPCTTRWVYLSKRSHSSQSFEEISAKHYKDTTLRRPESRKYNSCQDLAQEGKPRN